MWRGWQVLLNCDSLVPSGNNTPVAEAYANLHYRCKMDGIVDVGVALKKEVKLLRKELLKVNDVQLAHSKLLKSSHKPTFFAAYQVETAAAVLLPPPGNLLRLGALFTCVSLATGLCQVGAGRAAAGPCSGGPCPCA